MHPFEVEVPDPAQPSRMIAGTQQKATGCDLCMEHEEPSCVYACPHDAAHRVEPLAFFGGMFGAKDQKHDGLDRGYQQVRRTDGRHDGTSQVEH